MFCSPSLDRISSADLSERSRHALKLSLNGTIHFFCGTSGTRSDVVWVVGLTLALERASVGLDIEAIFAPLHSALVIATRAGALIHFVDRVQKRMMHDPKTDDLDLTTVEAIGRLIRITVLITSGLIILQTLGFSVSGVLAFGGLGGIAVGFAAKDLLSNFFGGLMIFLDQSIWGRRLDSLPGSDIRELLSR